MQEPPANESMPQSLRVHAQALSRMELHLTVFDDSTIAILTMSCGAGRILEWQPVARGSRRGVSVHRTIQQLGTAETCSVVKNFVLCRTQFHGR